MPLLLCVFIQSNQLEVLESVFKIPLWTEVCSSVKPAFEWPLIFLGGTVCGFRALYYPEIIPSVVVLLSRPHIID